MKVLVLNCGSSSVKFRFIETSRKRINDNADEELAKGMIEKIGLPGAEIHFYGKDNKYYHEVAEVLDHGFALEKAVSLLVNEEFGVIKSEDDIAAVGHRVVHGGESFSESVIVDENVEIEIQKCARFAPLHNPHNLKGIRVALEKFRGIPNIAAFDTGFHQSIEAKAYLYGIPSYFYYRDKIRKYGFHGLSHRYISFYLSRLLGKSKTEQKLISCHLGNGASVCAINSHESRDTSMGLSPLEGLVMGTRCGDLDPEAVIYLMAREGLSMNELNSMLNKHSGLLGISGVSNDMRTLIKEAKKGNINCRNAIDVFCYRLKKYIAAYMGVLNGCDAIVFTAGIGENVPEVREKALENMEYLGIKIDPAKNRKVTGSVGEISADDSQVKSYVIPTNEELVIARDTVRILEKK
ncbi:acetate/propionate family kinase [Elusimicrobiota bacterium]